ncbi:MAG: hypothetical protein GTO62_04535, partial [Planctomycetales bacterium]|nr:hypothetical protein [Planctomycetales bacterium]NIP68523.1 hypothetical protein [Planctomycetales bacterium]
MLILFGLMGAAGAPPATAQDEMSAEARSIADTAANLQNSGDFALAAEQWRLFVDKFPDVSMAPEA